MVKILISTFLFLCIESIASENKVSNDIRWRVVDWSPFYIAEGEHKNKGLFDELITLVQNELPEYKHYRLIMNTQRVLKEMARGTKVCHPSVLKETDAHLSLVNSFLLPHQIFVNPNVQHDFPNKSVALSKLLADKSLLAGISPGRYSAEINRIVEQYLMQENVYQQPSYKNSLQMLKAGRVDYVIEYPAITYYFSQKNMPYNKFSRIKIEESSASTFLPVYFACPKTPWGKMMIDKINKILIKESYTEGYLDFRLRWYDEESQEYLKEVYKKHYLDDKRS